MQHGGNGTGGSLREEDRDLVLVDGKEEQRRWLSVEVGEIAAFENRVCRKNVGQVEAKGQLTLKPRLYRVMVGR